jgi:predicted component of type VI protein secretion system
VGRDRSYLTLEILPQKDLAANRIYTFGFDVAKPFITIGKDKHCDLALKERSFSKLHAKIKMKPDGFYI